MLTNPLLLQTVLFLPFISFTLLFGSSAFPVPHTHVFTCSCLLLVDADFSGDFLQFFLVRDVVVKLVVLASLFSTLLTSPVFLFMHLPLPLLRPWQPKRRQCVCVFTSTLYLYSRTALRLWAPSQFMHSTRCTRVFDFGSTFHGPACEGPSNERGSRLGRTHHVMHAARIQAANWIKVIPFTTRQHIP